MFKEAERRLNTKVVHQNEQKWVNSHWKCIYIYPNENTGFSERSHFFRMCECVLSIHSAGNLCVCHFLSSRFILSNGANWCVHLHRLFSLVWNGCFFPLNEFPKCVFENHFVKVVMSLYVWDIFMTLSSIDVDMCFCMLCVCVCKIRATFPDDHCPTFYNLENYEQTKSVLVSVAPSNSTEIKLLSK